MTLTLARNVIAPPHALKLKFRPARTLAGACHRNKRDFYPHWVGGFRISRKGKLSSFGGLLAAFQLKLLEPDFNPDLIPVALIDLQSLH
jgi:hypothetical protein